MLQFHHVEGRTQYYDLSRDPVVQAMLEDSLVTGFL
jgi:hypothetical protein